MGTVVGMHWAESKSESEAVRRHQSLTGVERDFVASELGKLSASAAQLEPRIARLAERVGELRGLHTRLRAVKPPSQRTSSSTSAGGGARDGEGGPAFPPRRCADSAASSSRKDVDRARREIECLAEILTRLEQEATSHTVNWAALPGRQPVDGAHLAALFGNRLDPFDRRLRFHSGVDLAAPTGTPVFATAGGRVIFAGQKPGYGNVVEVAHSHSLFTRYAHVSRVVVRVGDLVLPRQHIADVGSTGRSTGPHLHFEVVDSGNPVDPAHYLDLFAASASHD